MRPGLRAAAGFLPSPVTLVDVGCRWGIDAAWAADPAFRIFAFDADGDECARLQATAPASVTYVPRALWSAPGSRRLHVTREPACSSLFEPDPDVVNRFPELACAREVGTAQVEVSTLDAWAADAGVAAVHALKLDVQGSELAVLEGAQDVLSAVRLIEAEVTFNPIYRGQPLFGDIDRFLRDRGFELWRLEHLVHYAPDPAAWAPFGRSDRQFFDSQPVDFRAGGGQLVWGHAYYCAATLARGAWRSWEGALEDALVAGVLGFGELHEAALAAALDRAPDAVREALREAPAADRTGKVG